MDSNIFVRRNYAIHSILNDIRIRARHDNSDKIDSVEYCPDNNTCSYDIYLWPCSEVFSQSNLSVFRHLLSFLINANEYFFYLD